MIQKLSELLGHKGLPGLKWVQLASIVVLLLALFTPPEWWPVFERAMVPPQMLVLIFSLAIVAITVVIAPLSFYLDDKYGRWWFM